MDTILAVGIAVVLCVEVWLLVKLSRMGTGDSRLQAIETRLDASRQEMVAVMGKNTAELAARIATSSGETRQQLSDRVSQDFQKIQQRIEGQLAEGRKEEYSRLDGMRTEIAASLATARKELQDGLQRSTGALEGRFALLQQKTEERLGGMRETVDKRLDLIAANVQTKLDENIREGFKHFNEVQQGLKAAEEQLRGVATVGASITELNNLLKLPHLRGKFGEMSLDRLLSDFLPAHLVERNAGVEGGERVEFMIRFPNAKLPIDSKFPREQVAALFDTNDPVKLTEARDRFGTVLKAEATRISKYIKPDAGTMDMALMFLPSETLYFEAIRDEKVWEELSKKRVYPVSPNTLAITLKGIAIASQYYEMAKGVKKTIEELQKAQRHFGNFEKQFEDIGEKLEKAEKAFSTAQTHLGHYQSSVVRLTGEQPDTALPGCVPDALPGGLRESDEPGGSSSKA